MKNSINLSISCDMETKDACDKFFEERASDVSGKNSINPQNLDGSTATWIVMATLAAQVVPHFLTFLSGEIERRRVKRIKIGDIEIEHPTKEDLRQLRKAISDHLGEDASDGTESTA